MSKSNLKCPWLVLLWLMTVFNPSTCQFKGHHSLGDGESFTLTGTIVWNAYLAGDEDPYWTFNTSEHRRIRFDFTRFHYDDTMDFGDGLSPGVNTRLARFQYVHGHGSSDYTNSYQPSDVLSVSNAAWVQTQALGFRYWVGGVQLCYVDIVITSIPVEVNQLEENVDFPIQTLSYPSSYPDNYFKLWDLRVQEGLSVVVNVDDFHTESGRDFLFFGIFGEDEDAFSNGEGFCNRWKRFSGSHDTQTLEAELIPKSSSWSSIKIIFSSNGYRTYKGFSIQVRAVRRQTSTLPSTSKTTHHYHVPAKSSLIISTEIDDSVSSTIQFSITTPWTWLSFNTSSDHRISISFEHLCFRDDSEIVEIGDGSNVDEDTRLARFRGSNLPSEVITVSSTAWMRIHIPMRYGLLRFRMIVTSVNFSEEVLPLGRQVFKYSPRFPNTYPNNAYNMWLIRVPPETVTIWIKFLLFDTEPRSDVLHIGRDVESFAVSSPRWKHLSGYYGNGTETLDFTSNGSSLTVIFTSDGEGSASGFFIGFMAEERVSTARTTFESDSDASNLTTFASDSNASILTTLSSSTQGISISSIEPRARFNDVPVICHTEKTCTPCSADSATKNVGPATGIMIAALIMTTSMLILIFIRWAHLKRRRHLQDLNQRVGTHKITDYPERDNDQATYLPMLKGLSPGNEASKSVQSFPEDPEYMFPLTEDSKPVKLVDKSSKGSVNRTYCTTLEGSIRRPDEPDDQEEHLYEAPHEMKT